MSFMEIMFWTGVLLVGYTYAGYPLILTLVNLIKDRSTTQKPVEAGQQPTVTVLIAAYNEGDYLRQKINNTKSLQYDHQKLRIMVVTDGSTDHSLNILKEFSDVEVFHQEERKGKNHAVNRVLPFVNSEILVLTDANALLNGDALKRLVQHFDEHEVGMVAGEKRVAAIQHNNASSGEGIYWRYESYLKRLDSRIGSTIGAAGELLAVRTHLMDAVPEGILIEDFYASLQVIKKGYRIVYEPKAYAVESGSATIKEELKRKIRISAGGIQAVLLSGWLLNPFRYGIVSWQYVSHRALRWTLAPFALPFLFVLNLLLVWNGSGVLYTGMLTAQLLVYLTALLGYVLNRNRVHNKLSLVVFYFLVMNYSVWLGALRLLRGKQSAVWDKALRAA